MANYDQMKADILAKAAASSGEKLTAAPKLNYAPMNPIEGFVRSIGTGIGESIGIEPSDEFKQFQEEQPITSAVGDIAGGLVPYIGWSKMAKAGKLGEFVKGGDEAAGLVAGAKRAAKTWAPYEAGRTAITALTGGNLQDVAGSAAFNLGAELTMGGLLGAWKAGGKAAKALGEDFDPGVDLRSPTQVQMRAVQDLIDGGTLDDAAKLSANAKLSRMTQAIQQEELPAAKGFRYVNALEDDADGKVLDRLFRTGQKGKGAKSGIAQHRFARTDRDFATTAERDGLAEAAGLAGKWDSVQFPRWVEGKTPEAKKVIGGIVKRQAKLKPINEDTWMGKEKDGLFVMAKAVKHGDREGFALWKTNDPGKFAPEQSAWLKRMDASHAWARDVAYVPDPAKPLDVLDEAASLANSLQMKSFAQARTGKLAKTMDKVYSAFGVEGESEISKRLQEFVRDYAAPAMFKFQKSPRASWIHTIARATYGKAGGLAHAMAYGDEALSGSQSLYGKMFKGAALSGKFGAKRAFRDIVKSLDDDEFHKFLDLTDQQIHGEALDALYASGEVSDNLLAALRDTDALDDFMVGQIRGVQKATGSKEFTSVKGHYGLSRTWEGDIRVPISDSNGRLVYMASGHNSATANKVADEIVRQGAEEGFTFSKGAQALADTETDAANAVQLRIGSPEYMTAAAIRAKVMREARAPKQLTNVRTGVGGYRTKYTRAELIDKYHKLADYRLRYSAELSVNKVLEAELLKLAVEDPKLYSELSRTLGALSGKQGEVNKAINGALDAVLAPVLGKNSGTKIASTLNQTFHTLTLGMGNIGHVLMNSTGFIQNVMPHAAFMLSSTDQSIARHMGWLPLLGSDGRPRGSVGFMDMMKLMRNSFREMGRPAADLSEAFARGTRDGTLAPEFVEEFGGQNASMIVNLRGVLKGEEPFSKFLLAVSNYLPAQSEKFARGQAFTTGYILGRDFKKLEGDQLYRFAKKFTESTMYAYSAADRPRIYTGPMGSVFGMFKNWQAHYIGSMLEYAGEGYARGNWNPLLWQMGGTAALGGVAALPVVGVADAFSRWATDESLMNNIYANFGGTDPNSNFGGPADAIYHGLPTFLGLSLSGSSAAPLSDPSRDASMLFGFVQADRAKALGQALGSAVDVWADTGQHPIQDARTRDLFIKALAPKSFARAASITEDQGLRSLNNGSKIAGNLNTAEQILYTLGLNPRRLAIANEVGEQLWKDQEAHREKITKMGRYWAEAQRERDWDMLHRLQNQALIEGVDIGRVISSARTQTQNQTKNVLDRKYNGRDLVQPRELGLIQ